MKAVIVESLTFVGAGLAIGLWFGSFVTNKRVADLDKRLTAVETVVCSPAGLLQCPAKTKEAPR